MRKKTVAAGLILISTMTLAAWAMAEAGPKDDKAAVIDLMHEILPKAGYDTMLDQMYTQMSASMQQMGKEALTPAKKNALKAAVQESLPYDDLINWTADVYTKHFNGWIDEVRYQTFNPIAAGAFEPTAFLITPEPGAAALLGLASLAFLRRRGRESNPHHSAAA